ncbi:50S ribosomal protein L11 methyltransferase [Bacillus cereus]
MKWSEISIHTTEEAVEAVSHILHEVGASGVAIEDPAGVNERARATIW